MTVPRPLEGIRVADFSWVIAGPWVGRTLGIQGAEVIKIETAKRLDSSRLYGQHPNMAGAFTDLNTGKMSISLDLDTPKGAEIAKQLVAVSDIVVENFSPRVMDEFGLGYEKLREINPRLIMISMPGYGLSGPYRDYVSLGPALQAVCGLTEITGYPDKDPTGMCSAIADFFCGVKGAVAALAAIRFRQRTGKGQHIEVSQFEASTAMLETAILDYTVNKRVRTRRGNRHPYAAPHGCYPCQGDDRWCTIAVFTDEDWTNFSQAIGHPAWCSEPRFATLLGRLKHVDDLDRLVGDWTAQRPAEEVMETLQSAGVSAGVVQTLENLLWHDPHLKERQFYENVEHPKIGKYWLDSVPFKWSTIENGIQGRTGALLGQHNQYVFHDLLGISEAEIAQLKEEKIIDAQLLPPEPPPEIKAMGS